MNSYKQSIAFTSIAEISNASALIILISIREEVSEREKLRLHVTDMCIYNT